MADKFAPINQDFIKHQINTILKYASELKENDLMRIAALKRADIYMDLVEAWQESQERKTNDQINNE